jgi:integrase
MAGIRHAGRGFGPRIHDVRHTFCCHTLQNAVEGGRELTNMLPYLSEYLGHGSLTATSQYLRMTAEVYPSVLSAIEKICSIVIPEVANGQA